MAFDNSATIETDSQKSPEFVLVLPYLRSLLAALFPFPDPKHRQLECVCRNESADADHDVTVKDCPCTYTRNHNYYSKTDPESRPLRPEPAHDFIPSLPYLCPSYQRNKSHSEACDYDYKQYGIH
jgi:hypothetical protein